MSSVWDVQASLRQSRLFRAAERRLAGLFSKQRRNARSRRPVMLSVELTNRCNLNCPFCLVGQQNQPSSTEHDSLMRGFGFMDFGMYEKIICDARQFGIERVQLFFQGEPLLHRRFPDMVRVAKQCGMETHVFTNGLMLTEALAEQIVEAGLDGMRFSVDGATEETYQQNRVGGSFSRVYQSMAMMAEKAKGSQLQLMWQFIALRNTEHEIERARRLASEIGIPFFVKTLAVTDPNLAPNDPEYLRRLHIKPCVDIYRAIFVFWNGDTVCCCYDIEGKHIVGNLARNTLEEVWSSPRYVELRRRIDNAYRDPDNEPDVCRSCLKWGHEPYQTSDGLIRWA